MSNAAGMPAHATTSLLRRVLFSGASAAIGAAAFLPVFAGVSQTQAELLVAESVQAGEVNDSDGRSAESIPTMQQELPQLVMELGSDSWPVREAAEKRLLLMNASLLVELDPLLRRTRDEEVLWRLERVYRSLLPQNAYASAERLQPGFLGIGFDIIGDDVDARIGEGCSAARVSMLIESGPAERGGVKVGDLLYSLNGRVFTGDFGSEHLQRMLIRLGAESEVKLGLLRGDEKVSINVTLDKRPAAVTDQRINSPVAAEEALARHVLDYLWEQYWAERKAGIGAGAAGDGGASDECSTGGAMTSGNFGMLPSTENGKQ